MCAKRLFLIRHAKSSWSDPTLSDHERPLNKRGKRDAPFMAELLREKSVIPDLVLSSDAVRALDTAAYFLDKLQVEKKKFTVVPDLYEASQYDILGVLKGVNEETGTLLVFGHNPGFTGFHNFICDHYISNIPTCGITEYAIPVKWNDLASMCAEFIGFEYPKKYFK